MTYMDEERIRFQEQLKALLKYAKEKKNMLESQEIVDFFKETELNTKKLEKIYDFLEKQGIDILRFQVRKRRMIYYWNRMRLI